MSMKPPKKISGFPKTIEPRNALSRRLAQLRLKFGCSFSLFGLYLSVLPYVCSIEEGSLNIGQEKSRVYDS